MTKMMMRLALVCSAITFALARAGEPPPPPPAPAVPAAGPTATGPKIRFATPVYDFGRARAGEPVKYTYVFTNTGNETLILTNVQPQCGCTAAGEWTRQVEPDKTGSIPIQFNTMAYNGPVFKQVTVTCNDKSQPTLFLQLKGTVFRPLDINPQMAVLNIPPDAEVGTTVVTITNNTDEPLMLSDPQSSNPKFHAELKTIAPGKGYQVMISTVPPVTAGGVQAQINLKSSWTNQPVIGLSVYANMQPALAVIPSHITLSPGPLANPQTPAVTIQNNSTNSVTLTDLAVNAPGVETQLRETQPGRTFSVMATFPEGFELKPGQQLELTVKSSNPKYPLVRVPITQLPRPVLPPPQVKAPTAASLSPPPAPLKPVKNVHVELPPPIPDVPTVR